MIDPATGRLRGPELHFSTVAHRAGSFSRLLFPPGRRWRLISGPNLFYFPDQNQPSFSWFNEVWPHYPDSLRLFPGEGPHAWMLRISRTYHRIYPFARRAENAIWNAGLSRGLPLLDIERQLGALFILLFF
jgi:hypothetical protein